MSTKFDYSGSTNLLLGQTPDLRKDSPYLREFQGIYNAIHILNQYFTLLAENIGGTGGTTPAEQVTFRRFIYGEAKQKITAGSVVAPYLNGFVNGCLKTLYYDTGLIQPARPQESRFAGLAIEDAEIGERVKVGIGPAIIKLTGAKCGQVVWAVGSTSERIHIKTPTSWLEGEDLVDNGGLYLAKIGYQLPGYPILLNFRERIDNYVLSCPIGVAVANDYVLFTGYMPEVGGA